MKPNRSYELQDKIDEKLQKLQKRKIHPLNTAAGAFGAGAGKMKNKNKEMAHIKWQTIKRHLQQHYLHQKDSEKGLKLQVKPMLANEELMDIIGRVMILQHSLIDLGQQVANYRRLQMGCIFFQCALSIIFNAYNLVVFLLKIAMDVGNIKLSLTMLLFFYGYHIMSSLTDIILSVVAYHTVFETIRKTGTIVDELYMYISDNVIKTRLSQFSTFVYNNLRVYTLFGVYNVDGTLVGSIISGTATYIIILIQYSGDGEICKKNIDMSNKTSTNAIKA